MARKKRRIPGKKLIFRPWITLPDGRVLHAWQVKIRAFPIWIDENQDTEE